MAELFTRYVELIYGVCLKYLKNREEAQDQTMQIFDKLRSVLHNVTINDFKPYLYTLVRNECLMLLRKKKTQENSAQRFMEWEAQTHLFEEPSLEANLERLAQCIARLTAEQRACVELFYLKKLCYAQVGQNTGFTLLQVKSYIQNGKRKLKNCMEQHGVPS